MEKEILGFFCLLKKALGYDYEEKTYKIVSIKEERIKERNGERIKLKIPVEKEILVTWTTKHVAPDTGTDTFWLENRLF